MRFTTSAVRQAAPIALAAAAALFLTACDDDDDATGPDAGVARVKVVHAIPDAGPVSVQIDDAAPALTNFTFPSVAPAGDGAYLSLPAGQRRVRVLLASGAPALDATPTLVAGRSYTVFASGRAAGPAAVAPAYLVLEDDVSAPPAGQVRVRAVHAAPSVGNVDVHVTVAGGTFGAGTRAFANVPFRGSGSANVAAGSYALCVIGAGTTPAADGGGCAILVPNTGALPAGAAVTAFARDAAAGETGPRLQTFVNRVPN